MAKMLLAQKYGQAGGVRMAYENTVSNFVKDSLTPIARDLAFHEIRFDPLHYAFYIGDHPPQKRNQVDVFFPEPCSEYAEVRLEHYVPIQPTFKQKVLAGFAGRGIQNTQKEVERVELYSLTNSLQEKFEEVLEIVKENRI